MYLLWWGGGYDESPIVGFSQAGVNCCRLFLLTTFIYMDGGRRGYKFQFTRADCGRISRAPGMSETT